MEVLQQTFVPVLGHVWIHPSSDWNLPCCTVICAFCCQNQLSTNTFKSLQMWLFYAGEETEMSVRPFGSTMTLSTQVSVWWASSCWGTRWRALKGQVFSSPASFGWFLDEKDIQETLKWGNNLKLTQAMNKKLIKTH